MRRLISFIILLAVIAAAFVGVYFFLNKENTKSEAEVPALPDLTVEPTVVAEATATPAPTAEVTAAPVVVVEVDQETGKTYYKSADTKVVVDYIRQNVSASDAVDAIELQAYGASMVVDHDDARIVEGITAYDLISDEDSLVVEFDRNADKLYVYSADKDFNLSSDSAKTFKGLKDSRAYGAWICEDHEAVRASVLVFEGYPEATGFRGTFKTANGFKAEVLKSIVLVNTESDRYDWAIATCSCVTEVKQSSGGNGGGNGGGGTGGGSKPTPTPAPGTDPTPTPTPKPTAPAHEPEATLPPKPTQQPAHEADPTLPPKKDEPTVTHVPEIGNPSHSTEQEAPAKKEESSTKQESTSGSEEKKPAANPTLPPKKTSSGSSSGSSSSSSSSNSGSSGGSAPAIGGVTF